jgi:hypothetical protein
MPNPTAAALALRRWDNLPAVAITAAAEAATEAATQDDGDRWAPLVFMALIDAIISFDCSASPNNFQPAVTVRFRRRRLALGLAPSTHRKPSTPGAAQSSTSHQAREGASSTNRSPARIQGLQHPDRRRLGPGREWLCLADQSLTNESWRVWTPGLNATDVMKPSPLWVLTNRGFARTDPETTAVIPPLTFPLFHGHT